MSGYVLNNGKGWDVKGNIFKRRKRSSMFCGEDVLLGIIEKKFLNCNF